MKDRLRYAAVLQVALFGTLAISCRGEDRRPAPVHSVDVYDAKRDVAADLAATIAMATKEKKRILVQLGGDWCGWCRLMGRFFHENEKVAAKLAADFIVMKVNYSDENRNSFFLRDFPAFESFPHLYVLDSEGRVLHSQPTGGFEKGGSYSEKIFLEFLDKWDGKD